MTDPLGKVVAFNLSEGNNMSHTIAEYIWIDGGNPTSRVRSKTKVLPYISEDSLSGRSLLEQLPEWSFDGSSTMQAEGGSSDCILKPVFVTRDPIRGGGFGANNILVLCEVFTSDGKPHPTNTRAKLRELLEANSDLGAWIGFEQEYTLFEGSRPLGFPSERRFPPAQGPYYCGVGSDEVSGRELVEDHLTKCISADLSIQGVNAEVMPGQWEFQIGGPDIDPLRASDELWIARWLLYRIGEGYDISATLDPKPVTGDWNGAGMHTNFSTNKTREEGGMAAIEKVMDYLAGNISEHLAEYGDGYEIRLTGKHETCRYDEFKWGVSDRTASVRIPVTTARDGHGYFEDRRPNSNADPYRVSLALVKAVISA